MFEHFSLERKMYVVMYVIPVCTYSYIHYTCSRRFYLLTTAYGMISVHTERLFFTNGVFKVALYFASKCREKVKLLLHMHIQTHTTSYYSETCRQYKKCFV